MINLSQINLHKSTNQRNLLSQLRKQAEIIICKMAKEIIQVEMDLNLEKKRIKGYHNKKDCKAKEAHQIIRIVS